MSFFSWFRDLFAPKPAVSATLDHSDEATEIVPRPAVAQDPPTTPEPPKRLEYFLSAAEHRAVEVLRLRRKMASDEAVIRFAIHRLCSLLEGGLKPELVVPPPIDKKVAWHFSIGPKTKNRLNMLGHKIGVNHHNVVIRIAIRELLANERIGI